MEIVSILLVGVLGSVHCVGMCGGFILALAHASPQGRRFIGRQAVYYLGKTAMYALIGAMVGGLGHLIGAFSGMQSMMSVVLGLLLVGIGLGVSGFIKQVGISPLKPVWNALSRKMGAFLRAPSYSSSFGLGLVNGLLPCGLVYGALVLAAASGTAFQGAILMAVFGLATIPALVIVASAGAIIKPNWRARINQYSGILLVVLGLITISRGFPSLHSHGDSHSAPTHHIEDEHQH